MPSRILCELYLHITEHEESNNSEDLLLQYSFLGGLLIFVWASVKLVAWLKARDNNKTLWTTVFEGLTQGAISLDHLKEPEIHIEKKSRRQGEDYENKELMEI